MKSKKLIYGLFFLIMGLVAGTVLSAKLNIFSRVESQDTVKLSEPSFEGFSLEDAVINVANTTG
ncbi:MAG: hypothetical protein NC916_01545, partial [Candidatus Omnitrophica bacterium]|nr:hypothetical protein [Candidatus Omnitrophota bacterium]